MSEYRPLVFGDPLPASFLAALQQFVGSASINLELSLANASTIQVVAGTGNEQVGLGIDGLWRYNSSTVNATVTGSPGAYDIFACCGPNDFTDVPSVDTDDTVYAFALQILPVGTTPTTNTSGPVSNYRKIGQLTWNGSSITGFGGTDPGGQSTSAWSSGDLKLSCSSSCPGWLVADGSVLERAAEPSLFAVIGTSYNTGGEEPTQFRLPNYGGRIPIGAGSRVGGWSWSVGQTHGEEQTTLGVNNVPAHTHGVSASMSGATATAHANIVAANALSDSYAAALNTSYGVGIRSANFDGDADGIWSVPVPDLPLPITHALDEWGPDQGNHSHDDSGHYHSFSTGFSTTTDGGNGTASGAFDTLPPVMGTYILIKT